MVACFVVLSVLWRHIFERHVPVPDVFGEPLQQLGQERAVSELIFTILSLTFIMFARSLQIIFNLLLAPVCVLQVWCSSVVISILAGF